MKNFNVLLTCCSIHVKEMIDCLKNNEDGVDIKVYVANSVAANLPPAELSDGNFVVPPISAPNYVETLISLCKEYDVSIIMPTATLELEIMARAKISLSKTVFSYLFLLLTVFWLPTIRLLFIVVMPA